MAKLNDALVTLDNHQGNCAMTIQMKPKTNENQANIATIAYKYTDSIASSY